MTCNICSALDCYFIGKEKGVCYNCFNPFSSYYPDRINLLPLNFLEKLLEFYEDYFKYYPHDVGSSEVMKVIKSNIFNKKLEDVIK